MPNPSSPRFSLMLSFSFIVLHFVFRPVAHFALIFVKDVRLMFLFLSTWISAPFVGNTGLYVLNCYCSHVIDQLITLCGSVSQLFILLHWSICLSMPCYLDYSSFCSKSWHQECKFSKFVFLQYCIGYSGSLASSYKF